MNTLYAEFVSPITEALSRDPNIIIRIQTYQQKLPKQPRETFVSLQTSKLVLFLQSLTLHPFPIQLTFSLNYSNLSTQPRIRALESTLFIYTHIPSISIPVALSRARRLLNRNPKRVQ
jgi:hypothetical protein